MRQSGGDWNRRLASWMLGYSEVLSSALLMVVPAVIGIAGDAWLGTSPWCLVVGTVVGLSSGLLRLTKSSGSATQRDRSSSGVAAAGQTASRNRAVSREVVDGGVRVTESGTGQLPSSGPAPDL
jgi:hypothetical protein